MPETIKSVSIIKSTLLFAIIIATISYLPNTTKAAATHGKTHEREADGAYSPRDKKHGEGDHHNSKFDHEAILGKY